MKNEVWSRRRWLARLSMSFLILAGLLFWLGYQGTRQHTMSSGRVTLCYVSAFLAMSLFFMGTREKHRRD